MGLHGSPPVPDELCGTADRRRELLEFRSTQDFRCKFFSNGREDFFIVYEILRVFSAKRELRRAIASKDAAKLSEVFAQGGLFSETFTQKDLAESILDGNFT